MLWKKHVVAALAALFIAVPLAVADDEYDDYEDTHPLRIAAYPVHAVGYALEWLIARPLHGLMAQPVLKSVFGHEQLPAFDFNEQLREMPAPVLTEAAPRLIPMQPVEPE